MNIRAACYYNIALFLRMTGWPGKGIAVVENALKENPFQMLPYRQLCLYLELVIANNLSGNYSTAQKYTQKGLDLAQKLQNWRLLGYIQTHAAQTELALGNLDASFKYVDQAMQLGRSHNLPVVLTRVYISLGDIFYSLGAYNPAIEAYQKGIEISTESNKSLELMYRLGGALSMVGQVESGMALLPQVISQAQAIDIEAIAIPAHVSLGRIYFAGGEVEKAWQEVLLASHQAQERGLYLNPPYANLVLGHFALSGGDTSAAKNYARLMVDQPKQPGNVIEEIGGLGLLRRALRLEQQDDSQVHQRLIQRLDEMGALAKREEIAPYFCAFREKLLAPLQA
jgi:tetratricopeptide (TPR) repeat protein